MASPIITLMRTALIKPAKLAAHPAPVSLGITPLIAPAADRYIFYPRVSSITTNGIPQANTKTK